eukprot:638389-Pleurochrysis_carterae.AAC.1
MCVSVCAIECVRECVRECVGAQARGGLRRLPPSNPPAAAHRRSQDALQLAHRGARPRAWRCSPGRSP